MAKYRHALPQTTGDFFLTDGGIETTLIFLEGEELPYFAAFDLLKSERGAAVLRRYFDTYARLATKLGAGLVLETATWRANPDWAAKIGYDQAALADANQQAVRLLEDVRHAHETPATPIVISGCVGPRGDGYVADTAMSADEAAAYHAPQIETFAAAGADLATAITMTYAEEAIGIATAAERAKIPVVLSFTVETDGRLPTGQSLGDAIEAVDAATAGHPAYYMINCAHPSHFDHAIAGDEPWLPRLRGLRANASRMSHAELDAAPELDDGDPRELGRDYAALRAGKLRSLSVMGGCCGTDDRHVAAIAEACLPSFATSR